MPRKCSVIFCKSNYDSTEEKVCVYGFPNEEAEREKWIKALPNKISNITRNIGICVKHWPPDCPTRQVKRFKRPIEPPSIFPGCPPSCIPSTSKERNIEERGITSRQRTEIEDELIAFDNEDRIISWSVFKNDITRSNSILNNKLCPVIFENCVKLYYIVDDQTDFVIQITGDFKVSAKRSHSPIVIRDLLGYQCCLERWSQLEAIIVRTKHSSLSPSIEVTATITNLQAKLQNSEDDVSVRRRFLCDQLMRLYEQRPYDAETFKVSCDLFLSTRSSYSRFRNVLTLPHPNTIKRHIGSIGTKIIGSETDAKNVIMRVFQKLSPSQLQCILMFDEVYVKPSVRFRGSHVIGKAADQPEKAARTVLSVMLKPLFCSESFVIRLLPVFSLTAEFLYSHLKTLIVIIHENGGTVVSLICDNASVNRKCFKMFNNKADVPWIGTIPEISPHDFFSFV